MFEFDRVLFQFEFRACFEMSRENFDIAQLSDVCSIRCMHAHIANATGSGADSPLPLIFESLTCTLAKVGLSYAFHLTHAWLQAPSAWKSQIKPGNFKLAVLAHFGLCTKPSKRTHTSFLSSLSGKKDASHKFLIRLAHYFGCVPIAFDEI